MFKVNNKVVILVALLLTLNIFHALLLVFLLLTLSRKMPAWIKEKKKFLLKDFLREQLFIRYPRTGFS